MKIIFLAMAVFVIYSCPSLADECPGDTPQDHRVRNFHFFTNSWSKPAGGDLFEYSTCVANRDRESDLYINWFIPGPNGNYVPSDEVLIWPRLREDRKPRPIDSCIEFGNLRDVTTAAFLGTSTDEAKNGSQRSPNCEQSASAPTTSSTDSTRGARLPEKWIAPIRAFFPADSTKPRESMLELNGSLMVRMISASGYTTSLSYQVHPFKGRQGGDPNAIEIRPVFALGDEALAALFRTQLPESLPLRDKDTIEFVVKSARENSWRTTEGRYLFIDRARNTVVGSLPFPLFAEISR